jgi:hypothetical protein
MMMILIIAVMTKIMEKKETRNRKMEEEEQETAIETCRSRGDTVNATVASRGMLADLTRFS